MKKKHALLLHGFGGGPYELDRLAQRLEDMGYSVSCPILAGHEDIPRGLARTTSSQWIQSAETALLDLGVPSEDVLVVGFSMGGLIAASLSERYSYKGMITINTPIDFWNLPQVAANLFHDVKTRSTVYLRRYLNAKGNSPVPAMIQFTRLLRRGKRCFPYVVCPLLVLQTKDDDTVGMRSPEFIYRNAGTRKKSIGYFSKGGHGVLTSSTGTKVVEVIETWLEQQGL